MGAKITIDSATLVNKGLEVIEAHWLYDVDYDAIDVVIHPQSLVHSAVQFVDGSLKAQLGTPDMRLPIQYAVTYPTRYPSPATAPDLLPAARLEFRAPDETALSGAPDRPRGRSDRIRAQRRRSSRPTRSPSPGSWPGRLDFPGIARTLDVGRDTLWPGGADQSPDVEELLALDAEVRATYATGTGRADGAVRGPEPASRS